MSQSIKVQFAGTFGDNLAARLELPSGTPRAFALFAHCFSCSKDILAAGRISRRLAGDGIAVLRFDFTGLGNSEGDFANTNFSSNIDDLVRAAEFLAAEYSAPSILIGHSLGGSAVIAAAHRIDAVKAVVTIGAPADASHVTTQFIDSVDEIRENGEAKVSLGGRPFTIKNQFLDDIDGQTLEHSLSALKRPVLICHSPIDATVGVENASRLFAAAMHPKSFLSLDDADHLLSRVADADHVADVVSAWVERYVSTRQTSTPPKPVKDGVVVQETGNGKFQSWVVNQDFVLLADEPQSVGGMGSGMTPYGYVSAGLAACSSMTIRMYADHKKIPLDRVTVTVIHNKSHVEDCESCEAGKSVKIDVFDKEIRLEGKLSEEDRQRLLEIAGRCPVHRTLHSEVKVRSRLAE
ncbi:MAG: osmotically inducible protein C [Hyphobacterium sp.]|nr:MAG: osmotically inducible protein C [Hyphobacterium sp.]